MSQFSRVRDSGVDLSWYDATQHQTQIWNVQAAPNTHAHAQTPEKQSTMYARAPQTPSTSGGHNPTSRTTPPTPLTEIEIQVKK